MVLQKLCTVFVILTYFFNQLNSLTTTTTTTTITTTSTTTTTTTIIPSTTNLASTTSLMPVPVSSTVLSTTTSMMNRTEEIMKSYNNTGSICCDFQKKCDKCNNYYDENSVRYCCPNCQGIAMVTSHICRCYPPSTFDLASITCSMSDKIVGDYLVYKPSYYVSGSAGLNGLKLVAFLAVAFILFEPL